MRAPSWRYKGMSRAMARKLSVYDGYTSPPRSVRGRRRKYKARGYTRGFRVYARDAEQKYNTVNRNIPFTTTANLAGAGVDYQFGVDENTSLSAVGQGSTAETRVGNAVTAKSLEISGQVIAASITIPNADTSSTGGLPTAVGSKSRTTFRIIVFIDRQFNSADTHVPVMAGNLLASNATQPLTNAMLYIPNLGRYKILGQKWINTDHTDPSKPFRFRINLRNLSMRYNGPTAGNLLQSNRIHISAVAFTPGANALDVQAFPAITYTSRMAFTDV